MLENCHNVRVIVDSCLSIAEVINCQKVTITIKS